MSHAVLPDGVPHTMVKSPQVQPHSPSPAWITRLATVLGAWELKVVQRVVAPRDLPSDRQGVDYPLLR
eukprot:m.82574 g.82574  ORF g.82574 m.82574 type:complete len:68 (+) comp11113_c0_seq4:554-757(+)